MTSGAIVLALLLVSQLPSGAAAHSADSSRHLSAELQGGGQTSVTRAQQRRFDRIFRKYSRGRISAKAAAARIADELDKHTEREGIYGVLFSADSPGDEQKVADLVEELKRVEAMRSRLLSKP